MCRLSLIAEGTVKINMFLHQNKDHVNHIRSSSSGCDNLFSHNYSVLQLMSTWCIVEIECCNTLLLLLVLPFWRSKDFNHVTHYCHAHAIPWQQRVFVLHLETEREPLRKTPGTKAWSGRWTSFNACPEPFCNPQNFTVDNTEEIIILYRTLNPMFSCNPSYCRSCSHRISSHR